MRADFEVAPGFGEELLEFHARLLVGGEAAGTAAVVGGASGDEGICVGFVDVVDVGERRKRRLFEALCGRLLLKRGKEIL